MSNNVPVLMLRGTNGKFFPVAGITGTGGGGGGTGGASTAANVSYTNTQLPNVKNVKAALDELVPDSHNHNNQPLPADGVQGMDDHSAVDSFLTDGRHNGNQKDGKKERDAGHHIRHP